MSAKPCVLGESLGFVQQLACCISVILYSRFLWATLFHTAVGNMQHEWVHLVCSAICARHRGTVLPAPETSQSLPGYTAPWRSRADVPTPYYGRRKHRAPSWHDALGLQVFKAAWTQAYTAACSCLGARGPHTALGQCLYPTCQ